MHFNIAYSAIFPIELLALQAIDNSIENNILLICSQVYFSDQQKQTIAVSSPFISVFLSFIPLAWIPSLATVIIAATWSYVIFKKSYT